MDRCIRLLNKHKKCLLLICTLITVFFTIVGFQQGIFQSQAKMEAFLSACGIFAPLFFVLLQAVQVVIPACIMSERDYKEEKSYVFFVRKIQCIYYEINTEKRENKQ